MQRSYLKEENTILRNCYNFRHNMGSLFYAMGNQLAKWNDRNSKTWKVHVEDCCMSYIMLHFVMPHGVSKMNLFCLDNADLDLIINLKFIWGIYINDYNNRKCWRNIVTAIHMLRKLWFKEILVKKKWLIF